MLQIPAEILSNIFQEVIAPAVDDNPTSTLIPPYKTLARLSEVCSLWHQVVNDTPALWSTIFSTYPIPVIDAFIRRSRDADLWFLGQQRPDRKSAVPMDLRVAIRILNQVHRLASLDAVISTHYISLITLRLCTDAPALVALKLRALEPNKGSTSPMTSVPQSRALPDTLFNGNRPTKLRHLHLDGFDIPWHSPLLVNLITLSLMQSAHCSKRPSYQEFFVAFNNMPSLEQVSLSGCLPRSFPRASNTKGRVVLCQLVKLTVSDDFAAIRRFLDILDSPRLASMALSGNLNESEPSAIFSRVAVLLGPRMRADPVRNVQFSINPRPTRSCVGFGIRFGNSKREDEPILRMTMVSPTYQEGNGEDTGCGTSRLSEQIIESAASAFPFKDVTLLYCQLNTSTTPELWTDSLIPRFYSIQTLILSSLAAQSFSDVCSTNLVDLSPRTDDTALPFPMLTAIVGDFPPQSSLQILEVIKRRAERGRPLICFDEKGGKWKWHASGSSSRL